MDPLSQGTLGAIAPQLIISRKRLGVAALFGLFAGIAPDLDVLIRSEEDPLMVLEYHRQFTHSLIFIPLGGLIIGFLMYWLFGRRWGINFKLSWLICSIGLGTHGLLDACTSYGTVMFWPFSEIRVAWSIISIVDPLFTLPILLFLIFAIIRKSKLLVYMGIFWVIAYLLLATYNRNTALEMVTEIAEERGHKTKKLDVKPSFANIWVWKTIYEYKNIFYVDAVHAGPKRVVFKGSSTPKLNINRDLPWLSMDSQQAKDIERFKWFSMGYVAIEANRPLHIGDIRYSALPEKIASLWSIKLDRNASPDQHIKYVTHRNFRKTNMARLWQMIVSGWN